MDKIKVLLVDDQLLFVESLQTVLETRVDDIEVIGIARNGKEAVKMTTKKEPDVVLMDIRMPEMNGVESTKIIAEKFPEIKVLVLTTFDDDEYVIEALKNGAFGYLMKDMFPEELIVAIRVVYRGSFLTSPKLVKKILKMVKNPGNLNEDKLNEADEEIYALSTLSDRELDVLKLMARGYENRGIAERLFIAEQTVKNYVSTIYSKLGVHDRVQATILAMKKGLV